MKVLVTGGAGFIGSHLTQLLCDLKYQVTVIDDLSAGRREFVDRRARFIKGSLVEAKLLDSILKNQRIVFHLAASTIIKDSFKKPWEHFENNFFNSLNLLEAMRKNGVKKIVFSSSAAVYGEPEKVPIQENDSTKPINIYGASKLTFEQVLAVYNRCFGIESVILRYFNVFGPRDECNKTPSRAVPIWSRAILKGGHLPLYEDGKQKRDYVFVGDVAQANVAVIPLIKDSQIFNVASGRAIKLRDLIAMLEKLTMKKAKIKKLGKRPGDVRILVADITKMKQASGWQPKTTLLQGLKKTLDYYSAELDS